jgi:ribulose-5-phosphate 4-epimerase/fuculose-1-phosphate aldolase
MPAYLKPNGKARLDCAAAYCLLAHFNMIDLIGNHLTLRVPGDNNRILINPYGWMYEEITASSLIYDQRRWQRIVEPAQQVGGRELRRLSHQ